MLKAPNTRCEKQNDLSRTKTAPVQNLLLAALSAADRLRLLGNQAPVDLSLSRTISESGDRIRHVYFPTDGFISLITPGVGRAQLEIGLVGNEGMLGIPLLLGVNVSPLRALVQGAGHAWQIDTAHFVDTLESHPGIRALFNRYLYVFISQLMQTATCTRFHLVEARLARWLLMTRDRAHSNEFHVTHEFLAYMLGVRRVGVTRAASALQQRELIRYSRGDLAILDVRGLEEAACPCYATDNTIYSRVLGNKHGTAIARSASKAGAINLAGEIAPALSC
jgi:CRP-like cAMP-binding protein